MKVARSTAWEFGHPSSQGDDLGGVCCVVCVQCLSTNLQDLWEQNINSSTYLFPERYFIPERLLWSWTQAQIEATQREQLFSSEREVEGLNCEFSKQELLKSLRMKHQNQHSPFIVSESPL